MLRSSLYDYGDVYILVKGTMTIAPALPPAAEPSNNDKEVVFKNCTPFTDCISEKSHTPIDNAKYIDLVMPVYNLIEYSDNYSKGSGSLSQYYRDVPVLTDAGAMSISMLLIIVLHLTLQGLGRFNSPPPPFPPPPTFFYIAFELLFR